MSFTRHRRASSRGSERSRLRLEALEPRMLLSGSVLAITGDLDFACQSDVIRLALDSSNPAMLNVYQNSDTATAQVDLSTVAQIQVFGLGGDDTLIVDSSNGPIAVPGGIAYDGGDGFDTLQLTGTADSQTYSMGADTSSGSIELVAGGVTTTLRYTNIEPVVDLVTAATLTVNGTHASNAINYWDGGGGTGVVSVDGFETIQFANKTTLVINAGAGSDVINLRNPNTPTGLVNIIVNGSDPTASDTLIVNGTGGQNAVTYEPTDLGDGTITGLGPSIGFTGIEHLVYDGRGGDDNLTVYSFGPDGLMLTPGTADDAGTLAFEFKTAGYTPTALQFSNLGFFGSLSLTDSGPDRLDRLIYLGTAVDDTFLVNAAGDAILNTRILVHTTSIGALTLAGLDGDDTFNVSGLSGLPGVSIFIQGGGPSDGDTLNFAATVGGPVSADLAARTIQEGGSGPVMYSGVETANISTGGQLLTISGDNTLNVIGTPGPDAINYTSTGPGAGSVAVNAAPPVNFSGAEQLIIDGQGGGDWLTYTTSVGGSRMTLTPGAAPDAGTIMAFMPAGIALLPVSYENLGVTGSVIFAHAGGVPMDMLDVMGTDNSDWFVLNSAGQVQILKVGSPFPATVPINTPGIAFLRLLGLEGDDVFQITGAQPVPYGVQVEGGGPSASDVLDFSGSGGPITVDLALQLVTETGFGPVGFTGVEVVRVRAATGNLDVLGSAGNDAFTVRPTGPNEATVLLPGAPMVNGSDIGILTINALGGNDVVTVEGDALDNAIDVSPAAVNVAGLETVNLLNHEGLVVNGLAGSDTFKVIPGAIPIDILGGPPIGQLQQPSGDLLNLIAGGQPTSLLPGPEPDSGTLSVAGSEPVSFDEVEQLLADGFPLPINTRVYTLANGQVIIYDSDAILQDGSVLTDVLPTHFRIGVDQQDDLRRVDLVGNPTGLGIILNSRDGGPVEFRDARRVPPTNIENLDFLYINGAVTRSYIRSPINGFDLSQIIVDEGLNGGVLDLDGDAQVHDPTAFFSAGPVNSFTIRNAFGDVAGDVVILGADPVGYAVQRFLLQNVTVAADADVVMPDGGIRNYGHWGGDFNGDLRVNGPIASLSMWGGAFAGELFVDDILRGAFGGPVTGGITFQADMRGTVSFRQGTGSLTFIGDMAGRMVSNGVFGGPARVLGDFLGYFGSGRTPNGPSTLFLTSGQTFNGFVSRIPGGLINVTGEDLLFGGAFAVIDVV